MRCRRRQRQMKVTGGRAGQRRGPLQPFRTVVEQSVEGAQFAKQDGSSSAIALVKNEWVGLRAVQRC